MGSSQVATTVTVVLPGALRARADNRARVQVAGRTIQEVIIALDEAHPGLRFNLCEETGEVRQYVNIFLGGENIRYLQGLATPVPAGATVHVLQSVAGG